MSSNSQSAPRRLIVVSNRLPLRVERRNGDFLFEPTIGGLATTLSSLSEEMDMLWHGWPGITIEDEEERAIIDRKLRQDHGYAPVFIPEEQFELFYSGFSNGCIWPLFHYFPQYAHYEHTEWQAYKEVNLRYRDKILEHASGEDRIWIHDYHLMLLPSLIREALPEAAIGFFLHIPFPSYEIFRTLPWRDEILEGLIGADLIGFHTFGYARHFLSALLRILGIEHDFGRILVDGRSVKVDTFPLGVDIKRFSSSIKTDAVRAELAKLQEQTQGRKVILTVDRMDFTKGILERLHAFERFLEDHDEWIGKVSLISLIVPSRTAVPEYQSLKRQVDELVGRINGRFGQPGWNPILYLYRSLPFENLVALYQHADVAMVTPLRDGMNLVAKEYLVSRPDGSGVLVLSETAGAAEELGEALIVNPHDERSIADALDRALRLSVEEQKARNQPMLDRLKRYDTTRWANDFMSQLEAMREERQVRMPRKLVGAKLEQMIKDYRESENRLLLLDYDGTLVHFVPNPRDAAPDKELCTSLKRLASEDGNTIVVISGRDAPTLESWFGDLGIDLVAEHGAQWRFASEKTWRQDEEFAAQGKTWKDQLRPLFEILVDRTPGAELEEKGAALVWHYRRAEPELASIRAAELTEALEGFVANTSLHILQGQKVIEVKPSTISKGKAAQPWLTRKPKPEFILAIGDDVTDEALFEALSQDHWSVKVRAEGHTKARFFLSDPEEVRAVLKKLSEETESS